MSDEAKAAFASATEAVKNTLTLSSAILTVSVTFLKDIALKNPKGVSSASVWTIEASWVFLFMAILMGVATLMSITGTLAKTTELHPDAIYGNNIKLPMSISVICFLVGVGLTAAFGMLTI